MIKKQYAQLDQKERDRIFLLKKKGLANSDIAKRLGRNKSTIGRELKRNIHRKIKNYEKTKTRKRLGKNGGEF